MDDRTNLRREQIEAPSAVPDEYISARNVTKYLKIVSHLPKAIFARARKEEYDEEYKTIERDSNTDIAGTDRTVSCQRYQ